MEAFKKELEKLINRHNIENVADVPDFILAEMVCGFIKSVGSQIKRTLDWHGCDSVCHPASHNEEVTVDEEDSRNNLDVQARI